MEKLNELVIIVRVAAYIGKDTWLDCGGKHLREKVRPLLPVDALMEGKAMYAIIHVQDQCASSDFGYASIKEAEETARTAHPEAKIVICR